MQLPVSGPVAGGGPAWPLVSVWVFSREGERWDLPLRHQGRGCWWGSEGVGGVLGGLQAGQRLGMRPLEQLAQLPGLGDSGRVRGPGVGAVLG